MGFRDDDLATRSRVEVLEREVRELRAENAQLQARPEPKPEPKPRDQAVWRRRLLIALVVVFALSLLAFVLAIFASDPKTRVLFAVLATVLLSATPSLAILRNHLLFVPAQHLLVLSGRQWRTPEGGHIGYRVLTSGAALRMPFLETSALLPTGPLPVEAQLAGIYFRESQVADLHVRASVSVPSGEPSVHHAVERFLGRDGEEIKRVATETLEGNIREVAAGMNVQELRDEPARAAAFALTKAQQDFEHLGLSLDSLEFHSVVEARKP